MDEVVGNVWFLSRFPDKADLEIAESKNLVVLFHLCFDDKEDSFLKEEAKLTVEAVERIKKKFPSKLWRVLFFVSPLTDEEFKKRTLKKLRKKSLCCFAGRGCCKV